MELVVPSKKKEEFVQKLVVTDVNPWTLMSTLGEV
jgi:hypothetical protein